jgi:hypothetical protein
MLKDPECLARYEESQHALARLSAVHEIQERMKELPQVPGICGNEGEHLTHRFSPGIYTRELFIPKHTFVIGKTHKHSHPVFFMQGKCRMWDVGAGTDPEDMEAPKIWVSMAGAKRVLLTLEDCIFATAHASDETDLDALEAELIVPESEAMQLSQLAALPRIV